MRTDAKPHSVRDPWDDDSEYVNHRADDGCGVSEDAVGHAPGLSRAPGNSGLGGGPWIYGAFTDGGGVGYGLGHVASAGRVLAEVDDR